MPNEEEKKFKAEGEQPGKDARPGKPEGRDGQKSPHGKRDRGHGKGGKRDGGGKDKPGKKKNDPSWYMINDDLGRAYASFPYNRPSGTDLGAFNTSPTAASVPGGAIINYVPAYGSFGEATDPINVAARALFSFIRKQNAGGTNYEAVDLMQYILAMDQVYNLVHYAKSILKLAYTYKVMNRTIPSVILEAISMSLSDITSNYMAYIGKLNLVIEKINNQFAVPSNLTLFKRRAYLQSNLFFDATDVTGQFYFFRPVAVYVYDGFARSSLDLAPGGVLYAQSLSGNFNSLLITLNNIVDGLIRNQDIAIMAGDILKKCESDLFKLQMAQFGESIDLVCDESILSQIENMTFGYGTLTTENKTVAVPGLTSEENPAYIPIIYQLDGIIKSNWYVQTTSSKFDGGVAAKFLSDRVVLNSHKDKPDYKDNLEYTRLIQTMSEESSGRRIVNFGTERIVTVDVICKATGANMVGGSGSSYSMINLTGLGYWARVTYDSTYDVVSTDDADDIPTTISTFRSMVADLMLKSTVLMAIDWHWKYIPVMTTYGSTGGVENVPIALGMDMKNTTSISAESLNGTHECALLALFNASIYGLK